jgi:Zn-dependent metalloprotease
LNWKTTIAAMAALATAGVAAVPIGANAAQQASDPGHAPSRANLMAAATAEAPALARTLDLRSGEQLVTKDVVLDANGARHVRYDRTFDGMRVIGGDLVVHQSPSGTVQGVDRAAPGSVAVASTRPSVSAGKARLTGQAES